MSRLLLFLILAILPSVGLAQGWPGIKRTLSVSEVDISRSISAVGDLAGAADILALELNQVGGATTALCSLTWEALQ